MSSSYEGCNDSGFPSRKCSGSLLQSLELPPRINPTINGRGRQVLIWDQTCRTLLGNKCKPLSGDKRMRTDKHGPNTWQGRLARIQTNVYTYTYGLNCIRVQTELKCIIYKQYMVNEWSFGREDQGLLVCDRLTIFGSMLKDSFVLDVKDDYWILHGLSDPIVSISDYKNQKRRSRRLCKDRNEQRTLKNKTVRSSTSEDRE